MILLLAYQEVEKVGHGRRECRTNKKDGETMKERENVLIM